MRSEGRKVTEANFWLCIGPFTFEVSWLGEDKSGQRWQAKMIGPLVVNKRITEEGFTKTGFESRMAAIESVELWLWFRGHIA